MKKILILNYEHHSNLGGTQTYTKNLIKIFTDKGYKVFEIDFHSFQKNIYIGNKNYEHIDHKINMPKRTNRIIDLPLIIFKFFWNTFKFNKLVNKTIKNKKINIVIDNTVDAISYTKKKKVEYIWIAHFDTIQLYNQQKIFSKKFIRSISLRSNKFKYKKIIVFTENDKEELLKIDKKIKSENVFACSLTHKNSSEIDNFNLQDKIEKAKNIVYMGKLEECQKNISFVSKIAEKLISQYIYIYGDGPDKNIIINKSGIKYQGTFNKSQVDEILKNAKLLILPSLFEGFPYVIVEALSNGVPCLVANTFSNASYLVDETRGKCIDNFDVDYWVKKIEFFQNLSKEDYLKFSKNALNFAKENLTNDKFKDFWLKLIKGN